jgi:radical SAM superfamily enzyme with C-terminal helix-hairpin-helix motif
LRLNSSRLSPRRLLVVPAMAAVLLLAACGGSSSSTPANTDSSAAGVDAPNSVAAPVRQAANTRLNLNIASGQDYLNKIPGFSDRFVREFMEYRPYASIQQFRRELGKYVSASQVAEWEKYVYVPVDVNKSDAETLKQIPSVDDSVANKLMAARPYTSNDAFLAKLSEVAPAVNLNEAKSYLATSS